MYWYRFILGKNSPRELHLLEAKEIQAGGFPVLYVVVVHSNLVGLVLQAPVVLEGPGVGRERNQAVSKHIELNRTYLFTFKLWITVDKRNDENS